MLRTAIELRSQELALALTTSWPNRKYKVRLHRGNLLVGTFLPVEFYFDRCRLENGHVTAAATLLAVAAGPPVLADAAAAAVLAVFHIYRDYPGILIVLISFWSGMG